MGVYIQGVSGMNTCDICGKEVPVCKGGQQLTATALENIVEGKGVSLTVRACTIDAEGKSQFLPNSNICLECAGAAILQLTNEMSQELRKV